MSNKAATIEQRATSNEQRATSNEQRANSCPLISVIVPVYKVEKYLDQCVSSILNQTYNNLEVILVDDGSPDNCPAMCDEWSRRDSRVRVIHKPNGGPDTARNAGLDVARGEYVGTIDSDDFIAPNMYEKLYALLAENDADISMCEFVQVDEEGHQLDKQKYEMKDEILSREDMLQKFCNNEIRVNHCYSWNKLYRAELFRELRFRGGIHEDTGTLHRIFGECRKIVISSEQLCFYRQRAGSITDTVRNHSFSYRSFKGHMEAFQDRYECFQQLNMPEAANNALLATLGMLRYALHHVNYFQFRNELKDSIHETLRRALSAKGLKMKLRIVRFALAWLCSIFRPFIDKEKIL